MYADPSKASKDESSDDKTPQTSTPPPSAAAVATTTEQQQQHGSPEDMHPAATPAAVVTSSITTQYALPPHTYHYSHVPQPMQSNAPTVSQTSTFEEWPRYQPHPAAPAPQYSSQEMNPVHLRQRPGMHVQLPAPSQDQPQYYFQASQMNQMQSTDFSNAWSQAGRGGYDSTPYRTYDDRTSAPPPVAAAMSLEASSMSKSQYGMPQGPAPAAGSSYYYSSFQPPKPESRISQSDSSPSRHHSSAPTPNFAQKPRYSSAGSQVYVSPADPSPNYRHPDMSRQQQLIHERNPSRPVEFLQSPSGMIPLSSGQEPTRAINPLVRSMESPSHQSSRAPTSSIGNGIHGSGHQYAKQLDSQSSYPGYPASVHPRYSSFGEVGQIPETSSGPPQPYNPAEMREMKYVAEYHTQTGRLLSPENYSYSGISRQPQSQTYSRVQVPTFPEQSSIYSQDNYPDQQQQQMQQYSEQYQHRRPRNNVPPNVHHQLTTDAAGAGQSSPIAVSSGSPLIIPVGTKIDTMKGGPLNKVQALSGSLPSSSERSSPPPQPLLPPPSSSRSLSQTPMVQEDHHRQQQYQQHQQRVITASSAPSAPSILASMSHHQKDAFSPPMSASSHPNEAPSGVAPPDTSNLTYIGLYEEVFDVNEEIPEGMVRVWMDPESHYHYDCSCGKRKAIRNLKAIQHHVQRHNVTKKSGRYPCDKCERVFTHYLGLNSHQRTHKD
eukprot:TRINITY_DN650_c0_g1_i14.p1 TRINITY_DN650_c0_g1~~TRINITY_DN650_c0_g1_i14.p1  ORF type:complete len:716 (+),score=101.82 TRINITY_DN650_c0_g1_i14:2690-4837(+)